VPALVFAEILYLSERNRITLSIRDVNNYLTRYPSINEHPLDLAVVGSAGEITDVPELHDRLIAGTARLLGVALITNDPVIQASAYVRTTW
jgi:predicted nucleic acid-binding protein